MCSWPKGSRLLAIVWEWRGLGCAQESTVGLERGTHDVVKRVVVAGDRAERVERALQVRVVC